MRIGFVGLGKLGLPTALAIESKGHTVIGCDPSAEVGSIFRDRRLPYREQGAQELLAGSAIRLAGLPEVVRQSEIVFVTIQTPHHPRYEGVTRLPPERRDFDYRYLTEGMTEVSAAVASLGEERIVVLVSTVLPGTIRREIQPLLDRRIRLCYNPLFIAMGTAIHDFLHPEFVLFGVDDEQAAETAGRFYRTIHAAPFFRTGLENAELIKVIYNTFISTKIAFANTVLELCHQLPGTDPDQVTAALALGSDRIVSAKYLSGGMGDGGACHPRDNIALSHLARTLGLSYDWFEGIMLQRERQTDWLAGLVDSHRGRLPVCILGSSFKPESNITTGSPALLLHELLRERGIAAARWDPHIDPAEDAPSETPHCYFVATRHDAFRGFPFPVGSVVIDPWRYIPDRPGVTVIRIGRRQAP